MGIEQNMESLSIEITRAAYPGNKKHTVLHDVQVIIPTHSFTAVIGRNGCGKSTLISCIAGLLSYEGTISLGGHPLEHLSLRERAAKIAVMQQSLRTPHISVETLVSFGRQPYLSLSGVLGAADHAAVETAMQMACLFDIRNQYLDRLSGGELRRAYLGMALAQDTPLLLLDEATANMDIDYEASFLSLLKTLPKEQNRTVISVMHNLSAAVRYADHILVVDGGSVCFFGTPDAFCISDIPKNVFHAFPVIAEIPRSFEQGERHGSGENSTGARIFFDAEGTIL